MGPLTQGHTDSTWQDQHLNTKSLSSQPGQNTHSEHPFSGFAGRALPSLLAHPLLGCWMSPSLSPGSTSASPSIGLTLRQEVRS